MRNVKIRIHYRARGTLELSHQIVCPYGFLYGNRHYLVAYSMNPEIRDYRLFSLANIETVEVLDFPFERRPDFSLKEYAERSFGVFQEEPFDVVWRFSSDAAPDAREFLFHPTQTMEDQPDGSLIVRFRAAVPNRGRDAHFWAPPAQIRTCGFPAYGSYLGCLTAKRTLGHG